MKASSFIAAWLCCTKPAWEWATAIVLLALLCTMFSHVQCKNEMRKRKRNLEIKERREKIWQINGEERWGKAKWQSCAVSPGSLTWHMAQDILFYYKWITCMGWIIRPGQPGASYSLTLSAQSFFLPLQVFSCCICWCSSVSDSKRKHASAWHLTVVPANSPTKRYRKWLVGQISAFTRHKLCQALSFAGRFGCIWMEQRIWGKRWEGKRHYHFQVLQALKNFNEKNSTATQKGHQRPMWKLMVSCSPMISRCCCTRNTWRLKGGVCPLWAQGSRQGRCEASMPEADFPRPRCTDCLAVDHEWHTVEGSVSRDGTKGKVQLEKKMHHCEKAHRATAGPLLCSAPTQYSWAFMKGALNKQRSRKWGKKTPRAFWRGILAEKKQCNKIGAFQHIVEHRTSWSKKPLPFHAPQRPPTHLPTQTAVLVPAFAYELLPHHSGSLWPAVSLVLCWAISRLLVLKMFYCTQLCVEKDGN